MIYDHFRVTGAHAFRRSKKRTKATFYSPTNEWIVPAVAVVRNRSRRNFYDRRRDMDHDPVADVQRCFRIMPRTLHFVLTICFFESLLESRLRPLEHATTNDFSSVVR